MSKIKFIKSISRMTKDMAERIKDGKVVMKSKDPEIQAALNKKVDELTGTKPATGKPTKIETVTTEKGVPIIRDARGNVNKELTKMAEQSIEITDTLIKADEEYTAIVIKNAKSVTESKKELQKQELAATAQFAGALTALAGENKALSAAQALINTYLAVTEVMKDQTIPSTALKFITAGTVLASG